VTSPVKACARVQKFPAGLGASNAWSGSSKIFQRPEQTGTTTTKPPIIPPAANETSSLLPRDKTILPRSSSNHVPPPSSPPRSASSNLPAVSFSIGSAFRGGSTPVHDDGKRNVDAVKTPSSTPATFSDPFRTPGVPRTVTNQLPPSILFSIPSSVPLRFPFLTDDFHTGVPVNPLLNTVDMISHSAHPVPLPKSPPTPGIPYSPKLKGRIGMLPDEKGAGARGSFPKQLEPPPDPSCSVVMEILPRKFRTQAFILEWLSQFPFRPSRYELVEGRVFIEFETEREALFAWNSSRMSGKEGLHGVRLFRYIATTTPTSEQLGSAKEVNATRTITNSTRPQSPQRDLASDGYSVSQTARPSSHSPQYNLAPLPQQPSTPTPNVEVHVKDPSSVSTSQTTSSSNTKMSLATHLFVNSSVPSPSTTTGPWVDPTTSSDPSNGRSANEFSTPRNEPFGGAVDFVPGASVSPTLVSFPMSPASSSTLVPSSASISPSMVPSLTTNTSDSWHASMVLDDKAHSPSHHRELMQESQLPVETSYPETGGKQDALAQVDADEHMEPADSVALAKEVALRQMVLQSRKRKLAAGADGQQPTSDSSATASRRALEELAVNFIADAISRPPPAKRIKITPSASALAAWGKRLETHIEKSRIIMAEIQQTQCKAEKDRLWAVLREHNRYVVRQPMSAPHVLWMIESIHASPTA
jgi:hypothetical protein